jgi:hypothetical protein
MTELFKQPHYSLLIFGFLLIIIAIAKKLETKFFKLTPATRGERLRLGAVGTVMILMGVLFPLREAPAGTSAELAGLPSRVKEMGDELRAVSQKIESLGASLVELKTRAEEIAVLRAEQARLRSEQAADFRKLDGDIRSLDTKVTILHIKVEGRLQGARIIGPEGQRIYEGRELDQFLADATKAMEKGKKLEVKTGTWDDLALTCIPQGYGCIMVGFVDKADESLAYRIDAHFVDERQAKSGLPTIWSSAMFDRCWPDAHPIGTALIANPALARGRRR